MSADEVMVYRSDTADHQALDNRTVGVIGYGNLGRSVALNLRDSEVGVIVGNIDDEFRQQAVDDGFDVRSIADASSSADVIYLLIPDEEIPEVFARDVAPYLLPERAVCFASGYVLAFELIAPPVNVDVLLLAPRMLGEEVRTSYLDGTGFFSFISVEQDASGKGTDLVLALAGGVGSLRRGAMVLSAKQEALLDLMVEQTVGPVLGGALITAFHAGVDAGLPPEAIVLELYMSGEMARTFSTFASAGFYRSTSWHGIVAQYGGYLRFGDIDLDEMNSAFQATIEDISAGRFAQALEEERRLGYPTMQTIRNMTAGDDPMTRAEEHVRDLLRVSDE